jgi:hypothetical protein
MAMEYVVVQSSNIDKIGSDDEEETLGVIFRNGGEYHYPNFPKSLHDELMNASSHGSFFHENIRYNYSFRRVA